MYQNKTNEPTKKQDTTRNQAPSQKPTLLQQSIIKHVGKVNGNPINIETLEKIRNIHKDKDGFSKTQQKMQEELDVIKKREQQQGTPQDQSKPEEEIIRNVDVYKRMIHDKYHIQIDNETVEQLMRASNSYGENAQDVIEAGQSMAQPKPEGSGYGRSKQPHLYINKSDPRYNPNKSAFKEDVINNDNDFREHGLTTENDDKALPSLGLALKDKVTNWARGKLDFSYILSMDIKSRTCDTYDISEVAKEFNEVASNFNTACVVLGDINISNRGKENYRPNYKLFYGQNQGFKLWKDAWKQKMTDVLEKNLTTIGFEAWDPKNCAEVDATQKATAAGVNLEHAHMYTVGVDYKNESLITRKPACLNCTTAFGSIIKDRNYSGWSEKMYKPFNNFEKELNNGYVKAIQRDECKDMSDGKINDASLQDRNKAKLSYKSINYS